MFSRSASRHRPQSRLLLALMLGTALTCGGLAGAPALAQTTSVERLSFGPK